MVQPCHKPQRGRYTDLHAAPALFHLHGQGGQTRFQGITAHLPRRLIEMDQLVQPLAAQGHAACHRAPGRCGVAAQLLEVLLQTFPHALLAAQHGQ